MGCISGIKTDKSEAFAYTLGEKGAPMIDAAKVTMECEVEDIYDLQGFDNFICRITGTYVDEEILTGKGKIDYRKFKPALFQFPTYEYLETGDILGSCMKMN